MTGMKEKPSDIDEMSRFRKLYILFKTTFLISLTANSGYAILSVMKTAFIEKYRWFTEEEMSDYIAMVQSAPGPIAINASMIIGWQAAGPAGSFAAVTGCTIPPLLVMMAVTLFYNRIVSNPYVSLFMKGMQFGVIAMLLDVLLGLFTNVTKKGFLYPCCLMVLSFLYLKLINRSVFFLALGCIVISAIKTMYTWKKGEKKPC